MIAEITPTDIEMYASRRSLEPIAFAIKDILEWG